MDKKQILKDAYEAGQNDMYVAEILNESAQQYIDDCVSDNTDEQLLNDIIDAYVDGFMFKEVDYD